MAKYQPQMAKYQPQMAKYQSQMSKYQWGMAKAQQSKLRTAKMEVMTTKQKMATRRRNQTVVGAMDEMSLRRGIQSSPENPFYRTQGIRMVYNQSLKNVPNKRNITKQFPGRRLSQLFEISQQLEALADSIPSNSPLPQVLFNVIVITGA